MDAPRYARRWGTPESNDEHARECWARWGKAGEPRPCDCGFFDPASGLVTCDDAQRRMCKAQMPGRLERSLREDRQRELRARRSLSPPFSKAPAGCCRWCGLAIPSKKDPAVMDTRRSWHKPCYRAYELHTRPAVQQAFLVDRDGPNCRRCGVLAGRYRRVWTENDPQAFRAKSAWFAELFPPDVGPLTVISWHSTLEVDHVVAIALIWDLPDEVRRHFYGPQNLQGLCCDCHKAKTREDMVLIRAKRAGEYQPPVTIFVK